MVCRKEGFQKYNASSVSKNSAAALACAYYNIVLISQQTEQAIVEADMSAKKLSAIRSASTLNGTIQIFEATPRMTLVPLSL